MLVLDVGCGLGSDTRRLASMVGSRGYAVGVDVNRALLSEARARSLGNRGPSFVLADASALPFGNDVFDRCRCERVLEHINDGLAAVTEITRVLKFNRNIKRGRDINAFDLDATGVIAAGTNLIRPERKPIRVRFPLQENGVVGLNA